MEEKLKIATRQSYGEKLAELGEKNRKIVVLDADLSGATKTNIFAKLSPIQKQIIHKNHSNVLYNKYYQFPTLFLIF